MKTLFSSEQDLDTLSRKCFGDPMHRGWRVRMRSRFGYFQSEAWYEGTVDRLVTKGGRWIDIGGGSSVFPNNEKLARELAGRCALLVGVDPSDNLDQNEFVHERAKTIIEDFKSEETFDLATLRMVAEHVEEPELVVQSLAELVKPGGYVVVYTPNRWSPASIAASLIPNKWHHYVTHWLWGTKQEDVFPTVYKMNTRRKLRALFGASGFVEAAFAHLGNCSSLQRFRLTCFLELSAWWMLRKFRIGYPENELLGIYRKV